MPIRTAVQVYADRRVNEEFPISRVEMIVFLTGISCVGKSTIGARLAMLLGCRFIDIDLAIEAFFETSIERLQKRFLTFHSYLDETSKVLDHVLADPENRESVIALPPSGLKARFGRVVKKSGGVVLVLSDKPENILKRIRFYDIDSRPLKMQLSPADRKYYLAEIRKSITWHKPDYARAHGVVDITGFDVDGAAHRIADYLKERRLVGASAPGL